MWTPLFPFAILASLRFLEANAQDFNYVGGIPLRTPGSCPVGSVVGQVTFEQNCCGADQTFVKVEGSVCCPDSIDCYDQVVEAPKVIIISQFPQFSSIKFFKRTQINHAN
jgi:hypothetical protein